MASLQQQGLRRSIRISDGVTYLIGIGNQIGHGKIDRYILLLSYQIGCKMFVYIWWMRNQS